MADVFERQVLNVRKPNKTPKFSGAQLTENVNCNTYVHLTTNN